MSDALWETLSTAFPGAASPSRFAWARYFHAIADEIAKRDPESEMSALAVEEWLRKEADRAGAGF